VSNSKGFEIFNVEIVSNTAKTASEQFVHQLKLNVFIILLTE